MYFNCETQNAIDMQQMRINLVCFVSALQQSKIYRIRFSIRNRRESSLRLRH